MTHNHSHSTTLQNRPIGICYPQAQKIHKPPLLNKNWASPSNCSLATLSLGPGDGYGGSGTTAVIAAWKVRNRCALPLSEQKQTRALFAIVVPTYYSSPSFLISISKVKKITTGIRTIRRASNAASHTRRASLTTIDDGELEDLFGSGSSSHTSGIISELRERGA